MINNDEKLLSYKQKVLLEIAKKVTNPNGFDVNAVARRIYTSEVNARDAVQKLWDLGFIKPINPSHWIYTKFENDNTAQKKLQVASDLTCEEKKCMK